MGKRLPATKVRSLLINTCVKSMALGIEFYYYCAMKNIVKQADEAPESVIATISGEAVTKLPVDLYIPPEALKVFLDAFEGPLDLLLYLIRRQNIDILNIPVMRITEQYLEYINIMQDMKIELAAEYLLMAAMLAEIKSRLLLPRPQEEEGDEEDPRAELVRRLQEYERFKKAAEDLDNLPQESRDTFRAKAKPPEFERKMPEPQVDMKELVLAFNNIMSRAKLYAHHKIQLETYSVRERMSIILERLNSSDHVQFSLLFTVEEGRKGAVVTFIAVLALLRDSMIEIVQPENYAPIYLKGLSHEA